MIPSTSRRPKGGVKRIAKLPESARSSVAPGDSVDGPTMPSVLEKPASASNPGEQYANWPYIERELDRMLEETSGCLDGAMSALARSVDPVVSDMSFRPLTLAAECAELQPLNGEYNCLPPVLSLSCGKKNTNSSLLYFFTLLFMQLE